MKKKIRQVTGTQIGVTFTKEEKEMYGLEVGKTIDMGNIVIEDKVCIEIDTLKEMTLGEIKKLTKELQNERTKNNR